MHIIESMEAASNFQEISNIKLKGHKTVTELGLVIID